MSFDDCKKTDELSGIPGLKKGDMVDGKGAGLDWLNGMPWSTTLIQMDRQLFSQNEALTADGKGRRLFYCFEGDFSAALAHMTYATKYKNTTFTYCPVD